MFGLLRGTGVVGRGSTLVVADSSSPKRLSRTPWLSYIESYRHQEDVVQCAYQIPRYLVGLQSFFHAFQNGASFPEAVHRWMEYDNPPSPKHQSIAPLAPFGGCSRQANGTVSAKMGCIYPVARSR